MGGLAGILQDVMRTFPYNEHLASSDQPMVLMLTRVLSAYSFRNPVRTPSPAAPSRAHSLGADWSALCVRAKCRTSATARA